MALPTSDRAAFGLVAKLDDGEYLRSAPIQRKIHYNNMWYTNPPSQKSICDPAIEKTQDVSEAKIIDFFEAREKLINEAQQYDRQFELAQDVQANSQKEKRFIILRNPMEDAVLIFLAAAFVVALVLTAFASQSSVSKRAKSIATSERLMQSGQFPASTIIT
jgi:hypothetical protein